MLPADRSCTRGAEVLTCVEPFHKRQGHNEKTKVWKRSFGQAKCGYMYFHNWNHRWHTRESGRAGIWQIHTISVHVCGGISVFKILKCWNLWWKSGAYHEVTFLVLQHCVVERIFKYFPPNPKEPMVATNLRAKKRGLKYPFLKNATTPKSKSLEVDHRFYIRFHFKC